MFYKTKVLNAVTDEVWANVSPASRNDVEAVVSGYLLFNDHFSYGFKMMAKQGKKYGMGAETTALMVIGAMSGIFSDVGDDAINGQPELVQRVISAIKGIAKKNESLLNPLGA